MDIKTEELHIRCACGSQQEHSIHMSRFTDDNDVIYMSYHLSTFGFWKRLKRGIRYIFGLRSKYGDFGELIITPEEAKKMSTYLDNFVQDNMFQPLRDKEKENKNN